MSLFDLTKEDLDILQQLVNNFNLAPIASVDEDQNGAVFMRSAEGFIIMMMNRTDFIAICTYIEKKKLGQA